ncbi:MAG TPA: hypothetical protein VK041_06585 [Opitutales bacterium]|nr:hypothetical protein [Opitutales bacterium]
MIIKKFSVLLFSFLALTFITGCVAHRGDRSYTNVAGGLYEHQENSYERVPAATIPLRKIDVDPAAEFSGNRTSILWGLFTYYDY